MPNAPKDSLLTISHYISSYICTIVCKQATGCNKRRVPTRHIYSVSFFCTPPNQCCTRETFGCSPFSRSELIPLDIFMSTVFVCPICQCVRVRYGCSHLVQPTLEPTPFPNILHSLYPHNIMWSVPGCDVQPLHPIVSITFNSATFII